MRRKSDRLLGPIDAQVRIGRSTVSAFEYVEWMKSKRKEATKTGGLNPVDATMIAQITPGEYENVYHAQQFAVDKLKNWLPKYKFKHWSETETNSRIVRALPSMWETTSSICQVWQSTQGP